MGERFDKFCCYMDRKIMNWVHENPDNRKQVCDRAMIVAISPLLIGCILGLIIIGLIALLE